MMALHPEDYQEASDVAAHNNDNVLSINAALHRYCSSLHTQNVLDVLLSCLQPCAAMGSIQTGSFRFKWHRITSFFHSCCLFSECTGDWGLSSVLGDLLQVHTLVRQHAISKSDLSIFWGCGQP